MAKASEAFSDDNWEYAASTTQITVESQTGYWRAYKPILITEAWIDAQVDPIGYEEVEIKVNDITVAQIASYTPSNGEQFNVADFPVKMEAGDRLSCHVTRPANSEYIVFSWAWREVHS